MFLTIPQLAKIPAKKRYGYFPYFLEKSLLCFIIYTPGCIVFMLSANLMDLAA